MQSQSNLSNLSNLSTDPDTLSDHFTPSSKRRKFYRKRTDAQYDAEPALSSAPSPQSMTLDQLIQNHAHPTQPHRQDADEEPSSVAEILRQRKAALRRKGGVEFTNNSTSTATASKPSDALTVKGDETPADIKAVVERFAPQTGQVSDVADKHMYAFLPTNLSRT